MPFPNPATQFRSGERQVELARRGGSVRSQAKSEAAKLRSFKKMLKLGKIKTKNPKWLLEKLENSNAFALDMLKDLEKLDKKNLPEKSRRLLLRLKAMIFKRIHGERYKFEEKQEIELTGINLTKIDIEFKIPDELKEFIKEKELINSDDNPQLQKLQKNKTIK